MNFEKWKKFFCEAGIPSSEASTYAYKFAHNRIQTNMLVDLNKDYLKEMNITIMGDVIAILRHAKLVYEDFQKTSKNKISEEPKDKRKEPATKLPKKTADPPVAKTENKSGKPIGVKRKSEPSPVHSKRPSSEPAKKSKISIPDLNVENIEDCEDLGYVMLDGSKKALFHQKLSKNVENRMKNLKIEKRETPHEMDVDLFMSEDDDDDDDNVEVIINEPIVTPYSGYKKFPQQDSNLSRFKEPQKPGNGNETGKRTVFKRLGEEISQHSVSSTTPFEDDEQYMLTGRKSKNDATKQTQEKNSVFHRLGMKCDVTSTSIDGNDKYSAEEKKPVVKIENRSKPNTSSNTISKGPPRLSRKIKLSKKDEKNPDSCLPASVKNMYTEGILAGPIKIRKLSIKERLGTSRNGPRSKSLPDPFTLNELRTQKFSSDKQRARILSINSKKRVSFGSVSEKLIPTREEGIRNGELPTALADRISVFSRLGFNRTYPNF